jgi:hypothetical protein
MRLQSAAGRVLFRVGWLWAKMHYATGTPLKREGEFVPHPSGKPGNNLGTAMSRIRESE